MLSLDHAGVLPSPNACLCSIFFLLSRQKRFPLLWKLCRICKVLQTDHKTSGHATSKLDKKTESGFSKMGGNDLVRTVVTNGSSARTCSKLCYSKSFSCDFSIKIVFLSASSNANGCLLSCFRTPDPTLVHCCCLPLASSGLWTSIAHRFRHSNGSSATFHLSC